MRSVDAEILDALLGKVRILSSVQVSRVWFEGNSRATGRALRTLERAGQIKCIGTSVFANPEFTTPKFVWTGLDQDEVPDFNQLAYHLAVRKPAMERGKIWTKTRKSILESQGHYRPRSVRRTDWEHDLAVTGIWISMRQELLESGASWILEDDLVDVEDFPEVLKPDAMLRRNGAPDILIEYGGRYSAETLRRKHESWSSQFYWFF